jgi:hypothetical protein
VHWGALSVDVLLPTITADAGRRRRDVLRTLAVDTASAPTRRARRARQPGLTAAVGRAPRRRLEYEQYEARDLAALVHRTGLLLVRTPGGATCFEAAWSSRPEPRTHGPW